MSESDEVDELGFFLHRDCPHCNAPYYRSDNGKPLCLNACDLPVWQYRIMQQGLREAGKRIKEQDREKGSTG